MKKFQFDIAYDLFSDAGLLDLSDGQDVTDIFKNDSMAPLTAVIVKAEGPRIVAGQADPVVEFGFTDGSHGYSWALSYGVVRDRNEFCSRSVPPWWLDQA